MGPDCDRIMDQELPTAFSREDALLLQLAESQFANAKLRFSTVQSEMASKYQLGPLDQLGFGGPGEVKIERAK